MKDSERKWSERNRNIHTLVTMDIDSVSKEVSKNISNLEVDAIKEKREDNKWRKFVDDTTVHIWIL
jgi:hypothetical protein